MLLPSRPALPATWPTWRSIRVNSGKTWRTWSMTPSLIIGKARCIISDGMDAGLWQLCTARDIMDSVVRVMAMAIDYRRQSGPAHIPHKDPGRSHTCPLMVLASLDKMWMLLLQKENSVKENDYKDHSKYYSQHRYFYSHDQSTLPQSWVLPRDWYRLASQPPL